VVEPGRVEEFLRPLAIGRLWGVGPRTREALESLGIRTIGDLATFDRRRLVGRFGPHAEHLQDLARGIDEREVVPEWEAKSYSHEETFARDLNDAEYLEAVLLDQAHRVSHRLRRDSVCGKIVQLKLRYHDFRTLTRRVTLDAPTADAGAIYQAGRGLFHANWDRAPVRLIGVGVGGIVPAGGETLELFSAPQEQDRRRRLVETIDRIEERFGHGKVVPAKVLGRREPDQDS
jgi:DNA polymerase-4